MHSVSVPAICRKRGGGPIGRRSGETERRWGAASGSEGSERMPSSPARKAERGPTN